MVVPPEPPLAANALNQSDGANDIGYFSLRSNAIRQDSALLPSTPVKSNSGGHLVPTNSYSSSKPSRRRSSNFLMQSRDNQDSSSASNKLTSTVAAPKQEGIYFKYLRVGDINVDVSTSGLGYIRYIVHLWA